MIGLIPTPYKLAAVGVATVGVFAYGFFTGYTWRTDDVEALEKVIAAYKAEQHALEVENERVRQEHERVNQESAAGWAAALAHARANPRIVRVREDCGGAAGLRPSSSTPGELARPHIEEPRFGATVDVAECEARLNFAIEDAAWIEHVKAWDRDMGGSRGGDR